MRLRILSTSDVHGNIYPTNFATKDAYNPFGYLKDIAMIKQIRQQYPDDIVVYIENGDFIEGAPMSSYAFKTQATDHFDQMFKELTQEAEADVGILGNHEFNYGIDYIKQVWQDVTYPLLSANILEDGQPLFAPYTVIEKQGVKIGIVGVTTQYIPHWEEPEHVKHLTFQSALTVAQKYVAQPRPVVDVVILAYHGGFEADLETGQPTETDTGENEGYKLLTQIPGVDAVVTGHQHRQIATIVNGIPTTQPGYRGEKIGQIILDLDENKQVVNAQAELLSVALVPPDAKMSRLTASWKQAVDAWLDQPLTTITGDMLIHDHLQARLYGHPYLELINQVEMAATGADVASTALFNNEIRGLDPQVTIRNILNGYPYPNTLVVERVTGKDLRTALERCASFFEVDDAGQVTVAQKFVYPKEQFYDYDFYSGIDYTFDLRQPVGHRVVRLQYHGQELGDHDQVDLALNQYRGIGGGEYPMFSADKIVRKYEDDVQGLLIDYLSQHATYQAQQPANLTIKY